METFPEFGLEEIIYENEVFKGPLKIYHTTSTKFEHKGTFSLKGQYLKKEKKIILNWKLQLNLI